MGAIRDIQVQRKLLDQFEKKINQVFGDYGDYLEKLEVQAIDQFVKQMDIKKTEKEIINIKKINSILNSLSDESGVSKLVQLMNEKTTLLNELKGNLDEDENIHKIRIILKQINYLLELSKKSLPRTKFIRIPLERLDQILKVFGEWHDLVNTLQYIKLYRSEIKPQDSNIDILEFYINQEKLILHQQIRQVVRKELKFKYVLAL